MQIEHIAIWTHDLEAMREFYTKFFHGTANTKYVNKKKNFSSCFISYQSGARLELMSMPGILENHNNSGDQHYGLIHFSFEVGDQNDVDSLTEEIRSAGHPVIDGPRVTGDGYYESTISDPEGNRIEIACTVNK